MNKTITKVFGLVVAIAIAVTASVPAASALTADELLSILISAGLITDANLAKTLAGTSSNSTSCGPFTMDLTMGSTGAEVTALQTFLESKGFLTIPAGVSKGYFGGLTKSALAAYQASVAISPAVGYFGPITRTKVSSSCVATTDGSDSSSGTDGISTVGKEGDFNDFSVLGSPSSTDIDEGSEEEVLGFEFEAQDSDLKVERIDFIFEAIAGGNGDADEKPWKNIESVTLMRDGDKVKTVDASSSSDWSEETDEDIDGESDDDSYRIRFAGLSEIVKEGKNSQWSLSVETKTVDDSDLTQTYRVAIDDNGIRAVDGAGIDQFVGTANSTSSNWKSFDITVVTAGDVVISEGDGPSTEDSQSLEVDRNNETKGIEALVFEVDVDEQDVLVDDIAILIATTSGNTATDITTIVDTAHLLLDGDKIESESTPTVTANGARYIFSGLDLDLEVGTHEFSIELDINELDGSSFAEGDGLNVTIDSNVTGSWDIEDSEGDAVTPTGSATGEDISFYTEGLSVELVSASYAKTSSADASVTGSADKVKYTLVFNATAFGDSDIYLDGDVVATATPTSGVTALPDGISWGTTSDSTTGTTTVSSVLTAAGSDSGDVSTSGAKAFKIDNGSTRKFTLDVVLTAGNDGIAAVKLTGIKWATGTTAPADTAFGNLYTFGLDEFETGIADLDYTN